MMSAEAQLRETASACPTCQFIEELTGQAGNANDDTDQEGHHHHHPQHHQLAFQVTDWDDGHIPEGLVQDQQGNESPKPYQDDENHNQHQQHVAGSCGGFQTRMVHYQRPFCSIQTDVDADTPAIHVFDRVVPTSVVDALYDWTVSLDRPWGTYVTMKQVQEIVESDQFPVDSIDDSNNNNQARSQKDLALHAVASFCQNALASSTPTIRTTADKSDDAPSSTTSTTPPPIVPWTRLLDEAHGVAIWALASPVGSQVPYHLDYAEQIRYDTNVICPPIYAGTLQCSKTEAKSVNENDIINDNDSVPRIMKGGDFWVNLQGLDHYRQYGYKGALVSNKHHECNPFGEKYESSDEKDNSLPPVTDTSSGWVRVPFSYNRIICHKGDLPHCSTKLEALPPNTMRVIVGFNVFPRIIGERVQQAPEHSNAFRRQVQLRRFWLLQQQKQQLYTSTDLLRNPPHPCVDDGETRGAVVKGTTTTKPCGEVFTLNMIQSNKGLTKLFVLAKRQRVQSLFHQARVKLERDILQLVRQHQQQDNEHVRLQPVPVLYVMDQLGQTKTTKESSNAGEEQENKPSMMERTKEDDDFDLLGWPTPLDVQVQIHHMLLESNSTVGSSHGRRHGCKLQRWIASVPIPVPKDDHCDDRSSKKKLLVAPETLVYVVESASTTIVDSKPVNVPMIGAVRVN